MLTAPVYSQNPEQESKPAQQQPTAELYGGEQATIIIKIQQTEQTKNESKPAGDHRIEQRGDSWFQGWNLSDKIAGIAIFIGFLQFLALIATVWVMMKTSRRQLRAYVFADSAALFDGTTVEPPMPENANRPFIVLNFKNSGQTPAYKVISWANIDVVTLDQQGSLFAPKTLEEKFTNNIGPGGVMPKTLWGPRILTPDEISDVEKVAKAIFLYGRVEYRDAFRRKRQTTFRLAYAGKFPPAKGAIFAMAEEGNNAN